jgi:hypothetical protein
MKLTLACLALVLGAVPMVAVDPVPSDRDPRITNSVNPNVTYSINPNVTYSLNPEVNYSINPKATYSINPNVTYAINPNVTYSLNPKVNYSINPNVTASLNPTKAKWSGYFIFDRKLALVGIAVRANPDVLLLFNSQIEWIGYFVRAEKNFNRFDLDGEWTGFLSENSKGAYTYFTIQGEWLWFLT